MPFNISLFHKKKNTETNGLYLKKSSPLDIPEILEIIFSFIPPSALRKNIALVCRQWHTLSHAIIPPRPITWRVDHLRRTEELQEMANSLDKAPNLTISISRSRYHQHMKETFANLINLTAGLQVNIKDLAITESTFPTEYENETALLLNFSGRTLRSLRLEHISHPYAPLDLILGACPQLHTLSITKVANEQTRNYSHTQLIEQPSLTTTLMLQSLTLRATKIHINTLTGILRSSPNLYELRLMCIAGFHEPPAIGRNYINNTAITSVFQRSFYTHIALSCPMLRKLHLSDKSQLYDQNLGLEELENLVKVFPLISDWGFCEWIFHRMSCSSMRPFMQNVVTSLELYEDCTHVLAHQNTLHEYLCESPQLLHLIAPDISFRTLLFDIEGILSNGKYIVNSYDYIKYYRNYELHLEPCFRRKIWACRNLKTLQLKFLYCGTPEESRLLFGYISKVCPRLQELSIRLDRMTIQHDGGMCLLARLHDLRKLKIGYDTWFNSTCTEFDWISKDLSPRLWRKMWIWIVKFKHQEPKKLYARTPFHSNNRAREFPGGDYTPGIKGDHIIDGVDMSYLGREIDIVKCYQERLANDLPCFPNLEHISLNKITAVNELKKFRPDIRVSLWK